MALAEFKLLFWHLTGEIEEITKKPQSHQLVPTLILKLGTLQTWRRSATCSTQTFGHNSYKVPLQHKMESVPRSMIHTCLFMWGYMLECIPSLKLMLGIIQCQSLPCSLISHLFCCVRSVWWQTWWPWVLFFFYYYIFCNSICCTCNSKINM